jgi:serine protease Do
VDAQGRLIGINDAMISPSGTSAGIGLAVPVNMARNVMEGFLNGGKVARGYLGVDSQDIDAGLAKGFGVPNAEGALVTEVSLGSPAAKAGVLAGDVVVEINDKPISSKDSLRVVVSELRPGSKVDVKIYRNGVPKTLLITLAERPDIGQPVVKSEDSTTRPPKADALDGVAVQDLDPQLRKELRTPLDVAGALIIDVDHGSNSFEAGLRRGDVIVEINHFPVANAEDAVKLCKAARTEEILVKIWHLERDGVGRVRFLSVDNTKRTQ